MNSRETAATGNRPVALTGLPARRPAGADPCRRDRPCRSPGRWVPLLGGILLVLSVMPGCSWQAAKPLQYENARLAEDVRILGQKLDELAQAEAETRKIRATIKQLQAEFDSLAASHPEAARRVREATMNR